MQIKESSEGMELSIKVIPKSAKNTLVGWENGRLKIRLHAVPEKGDANRELIVFLAEVLGIPKSWICLMRGKTGRLKTVLIQGLSKQTLEDRLGDALKNRL